MRRLTIATLLVALTLPMATAVADDQNCTTLTVEWTDEGQPHITEVHYATTGVRVAMVGDYLWTQYETTNDPNEGGPVLSTFITAGVTAITACPDGIVTMTTPPPPPVEDPEIGETTTEINVIDYWQGRGYRVY